MVKTYYFNNDSIKKIKEMINEFRFVKLSDFITFLNIAKIKDGDVVNINSDLLLDMKDFKHDNNIDFIFDMPIIIKSDCTFTISNADTKNNNIRYFRFIKPITINGTLELNHLTCNDSQIDIDKKGTLIIKSILHNGYGDSSESIIINNGKFINERVIYNNSKIINNGEYVHGDYSYVMTYNNKIFDNKRIIRIVNGEFFNAFKDIKIIKNEKRLREETKQKPINKKVEEEQIQEDVKVNNSINKIKKDNEQQEEKQQTLYEVINVELVESKQESNLILSTLSESTVKQVINYGTVYNYGTIELVKGLFKTSGEVDLTDSMFNINGGILELVNGIIYSNKSSISLISGTIQLKSGKLNIRDNSTLTILNGEFIMLSSTLKLFDTCFFIVKGGNVDLNDQFNIKGGNIVFEQDKFKTKDSQIILTSRIKGDVINHNNLDSIIDTETTDDSELNDDMQYILKSEFEKYCEKILNEKQNEIEKILKEKQDEIEKIKSEFFEKMDIKEKEFKKQLEMTKKQKTIKEIVDNKIVIESLFNITRLVENKYCLTFKYDSNIDKLIPILDVEPPEIEIDDDITIEKEASKLIEEIIGFSETNVEIQKLLSKISSIKYSKIFTKTIELLRKQIHYRNLFLCNDKNEDLNQKILNNNIMSLNKFTPKSIDTQDISNTNLNIKNAINKVNIIAINNVNIIETPQHINQTEEKTDLTTKQENQTKIITVDKKRKIISNKPRLELSKVKHKRKLI